MNLCPQTAQTVPLAQTSSIRKSRQIKWRSLGLAISLAHLCLIEVWFGLLWEEDHGYFNLLPVTRVGLVALLFNLVLLALVFYVLDTLRRNISHRLLDGAACAAVAVLLVVPINFFRGSGLHLKGHEVKALMQSALGVAGVVLLAVVFIRWRKQILRLLPVGLLILLPWTALTVGKAVWLLTGGTKVRASYAGLPVASGVVPRLSSEPRVVWIIFDELDYRLALAERPAALALPELDRMVAESLVASQAFPPGGSTETSIPALLSGLSVTNASPSSRSDLSLQLRDGTQVHWSQLTNMFERTQAIGVRNAVVGWYHPYSRLFGRWVEDCSWWPYPRFDQERAESFVESVSQQLHTIISPWQLRRQYISLYQASEAEALRVVTNRTFGLTFLHLPMPHLPGIYQPKTGDFTTWDFSTGQAYLDNLCLMDRTLGAIRQAMETSDNWSRSWVVLSADHWFREAAKYDGRLDHRVPFLVKAPQAMHGTYDQPFDTRVTQELILAILRGEVSEIADVQAWLKRNHLPPPESYPGAAQVPDRGGSKTTQLQR
jgi:hypothetical protein